MAEQQIVLRRLSEYPYKSIALGTTRANLTGRWRYWRPYYQTRRAPCDAHCPVGSPAIGFVQAASDGSWERAATMLREENPLAAVTARVCYRPCEAACHRRQYDAPIAIQAVERVAADQTVDVPAFPPADRPRSVAVVGSGPAGLTFAYYMAAFGHRVSLFEARRDLGGLLRYGIPPYRLPKVVLDREIERLLAAGIQIRSDCRLGRDVSLEELEAQYEAVFLAPGASRSLAIRVPGEDTGAVTPGLEFLRRVHEGGIRGLKGRVAVVGGGNTAIDAARTALRLGADAVILYRRSRNEMPAHVDEIDRAEAEGVQVETLVAPVELQRRGRTVTGLVIRRNELGAPGPDGRPVPVPLPDTEETWPFDLVISAIGEAVDADVAPGLTWGSAGLVVDEWGRTGRAEVWAAGDVVDMPRTVADAIGRAKRAALLLDARWRGLDPAVMLSRIQVAGGPAVSMAKYREALAGQPSSRAEDVVAYDQLNAEFFEPAAPRVALPQLPPGDGRHSFREVVGTLSAEAAASEAARCLSCGHCNGCDNCWIYCPDLCVSRESGHYHIDYDYCKGCTLCVAVCPRGAISTAEERKWRG